MAIPDVVLVEPPIFDDPRGAFLELYKRSEFLRVGIGEAFVQDNYSHSKRGVLRGLHYQTAPQAQGKLVTALTGEIFDVAVDLRRGSPTFGRWTSAILSRANRRLLYVPAGFAHGFYVLSAEADVIYKVTAEYAPALEHGVAWNDPDLGIGWPTTDPLLSPKDARLPTLRSGEHELHALLQGGPVR
jgi:dTDP-4-dehydrorhamnose 3,5-epimerase